MHTEQWKEDDVKFKPKWVKSSNGSSFICNAKSGNINRVGHSDLQISKEKHQMKIKLALSQLLHNIGLNSDYAE